MKRMYNKGSAIYRQEPTRNVCSKLSIAFSKRKCLRLETQGLRIRQYIKKAFITSVFTVVYIKAFKGIFFIFLRQMTGD